MFKKNTKRIIFKAQKEHSQFLTSIPKPSATVIPEWYKKQKNFSNNENSLIKSFKSPAVGTFKLCTPLIDTMTSGYLFLLPADILVKNIGVNGEYLPFIEWRVDWSVIDAMDPATHPGYPVPHGFNKNMFRWSSDFKIETPSGYSCWITHPSHRWDLPFITINGFIDTDKHPNGVLFPFFIREGFEGIIKEGTPIAQIIPFKRDNWKSEKGDLSEGDYFMQRNATSVNYTKTYKNKYWSRKKYE